MAATPMETCAQARFTDEQLFDIYARDGDPAARDELVERFMPFARKLAMRYSHTSEPMDDLVQVACVGLLNAIERFDPAHGKRFVGFATPTILGELKRYFRDKGWTIHVPRDVQERALAASRHAERLSGGLGRSPTLGELAGALHCTVEEAAEAIDAADNYRLASLDAPVAEDDDDRCALVDILACEDDGFEIAEDRQMLAARWAELSELEREVLSLRLGHGLTQREISRRIGCSQMHVSRLLRRSMLSLNGDVVSATTA